MAVAWLIDLVLRG